MTARRLLLASAAAATTALVALPAYATIDPPVGGPVPAATPTRIPPVPGATSAPPVPDGAAPTATGGVGGGASTTSPPAAPTFSPRPAPGALAPPAATKITPQNRFAVRTTGADADATWPDASTLFTAGELAQVVPGVTAVRATECSPGQLPGGRPTTRAVRCTLTLTVPSSRTPVPSRLMVVIRGFGTPPNVGRSWTPTFAAQQERASHRPGLYTFYRNGSLGASAAYTDGTTTRVLLQRGSVAGEIWFSGVGFTGLKPDYLQSRADFRTRVVPALVQLLAAKMGA